MNLMEQWEQRKREIQAALADGKIQPDEAARELAHLDCRLKRRPLILKRRKDRKAWRKAQAERWRCQG